MEAYKLLALFVLFGYGLATVLYKLASKEVGPFVTAFVVSLFIMGTSLALLLTQKQAVTISRSALLYLVGAGLLAGCSFAAYIVSLHIGKVSIASTLRGLSFLVTTLFAIFLLNENISLQNIIGIVLAVISIVLLTI